MLSTIENFIEEVKIVFEDTDNNFDLIDGKPDTIELLDNDSRLQSTIKFNDFRR